MTITLRIENFDQLPDGGPLQFQVAGRGFEIGREPHLDWSLPDPSRVISGRHCEIRYEKGGYWLFDVSRNGTFLNGSSTRVRSPHRLENGDSLQIGHYLIKVSVAAGEAYGAPPPAEAYGGPPPGEAPATGGDSIWEIGGAAPDPVDRRAFMPQDRGQRAPDFSQQFLELPEMRPAPGAVEAFGAPAGPRQSPFGEAAPPVRPVPQPAPALPPLESAPPYGEPFAGAMRAAPLPAAAPQIQPQQPGYAPGEGQRAYQPQPPVAPPPPPMPHPASGAPDAAFLRGLALGAGVPAGTFDHRNPEELGQEIGAALRVVLEQAAALLKARAAAKVMAKSANRTMIGADHNNPLKFIPSAAEVIDVMFARPRPGYLDARRALEEAFSDLKTHEVATFAAMQKALLKLIDGLSPQSIENKVSGSAFSSKKAKAWDLFVERWDAKTDPYENGMLDVFLSYFAEAYDEAARKR